MSPVSIVPGWAAEVDWRGRRSGSGLCWGATRRGIAGPKTHGDAVNAGEFCSSALLFVEPRLAFFLLLHHCRFSYALKTHCRDKHGARGWSGTYSRAIRQLIVILDWAVNDACGNTRITLYPVREKPCCGKPRYPNPSCTGCRGKAQKRRDPSTRTVGVPWVGTVTRLSWVTSAVIVARPLFARLEHGASGHQADGQVAPQRNHELACQRHDGDAADPAFGVADTLAEPLAQFTVGLMS
jgi:hypothetical protein